MNQSSLSQSLRGFISRFSNLFAAAPFRHRRRSSPANFAAAHVEPLELRKLLTAAVGAPTITLNPTNQTAPANGSVTFTAAATGTPSPTVVWQSSTDHGATFKNIGGATSTTLNFHTLESQDGDEFRAVFTNSNGTATTTAATLTISGLSAPVITMNPTNHTSAAGQAVTFTAAASAQPTASVQWQISTNGGSTFTNVTGATSPTLHFTTRQSQNGDLFRAVFTNTKGSATTTAASLTLTTTGMVPPVITTNPTNQTVAMGQPVTFTAAAQSNPGPTAAQWQVSTNGGKTFQNISGATSTSLNFQTLLQDDGNQYRVIFTNSAGSTTSSVATLTVTGAMAPTITREPTDQNAVAGRAATFTAAANAVPVATVIWQISTDGGTTFQNIPGATSATLNFTTKFSQNGDFFRAIFTNSKGSATTTTAKLTVSVTG